jgi:hypothetical protein
MSIHSSGADLIRTAAVLLALLAAASGTLEAQQPRRSLTNSDVLSMVKSGMGEETIVLAIKQGPAGFDLSPEALIELKKEGVPDRVLNTMLEAPASGAKSAAESATQAADLFEKALSALGPRGFNRKLQPYGLVTATWRAEGSPRARLPHIVQRRFSARASRSSILR